MQYVNSLQEANMGKQKKVLPNDLLARHVLVVDIEQVSELTRFSPSKINLMIGDDKEYSDPSFPKPIPLIGESRKKGRRIVWILDEVLIWILNQIIKARGELPKCLKDKSGEYGLS